MRAIPLTLGLLAAASLAGCSRNKAPAPADKAQTRQEILALQKQFREAVRAKNAPAVVALMSPDFVQVNDDGTTLSRDEVAGELKKNWPAIRSIQSWTMELDDLTLDGKTAEGRVTDHLKAVVTKPGGGTRTVEVSETTSTVWERTADGWRYKRITESPEVAVAPQKPVDGLQFVPIKEWAKDSRRTRAALAAEQRRKEAASAKPVKKAAAGMTPQQTRQMLTDLYARYREAVRRKDAKTALALLTDDYTVAAGQVALPRWEVEKSLRRDLDRTRSIEKWTMTLEDIAAQGNSLVVVLTEDRVAMVEDAKGRVRRIHAHDRMRDTWIKTPSGWKTQKTEVLPD